MSLRTLLSNTLITGFTFVVSAVVPLLLIPLFVNEYGIIQYGLIVLARILLPTGTLGIFDFGNAEVATQIIAQGRHGNDWREAGRRLTALATLSSIVGVVVSIALILAAPALADLFRVPVESQATFSMVIRVTGATFTILLLTLMVEGVLKGFEEFRKLRTAELIIAAGWGLSAVAVIAAKLPFQWVAYAYLAWLLVRSVMLGIIALRVVRRHGIAMGMPSPPERADIRHRCSGMVGNRMIGAVQSQAPPLLISALIGPSALGVYDLIIRFPRFLKVAIGLMNTAVLPLSARLDAAGDVAGMRRLGEIGLLGALVAAAPICAWGASFAEPLLSVWVGPEYARYWHWQALMFVVPLVNALTSFACGALLARPDAVRKINIITFVQISAQLAIALGFMKYFGERSFILGQALAVAGSLPFQMRLVAQEKKLEWPAFRRHFAIAGIFALATALCLALGVGAYVHSLIALGVTAALWLVASYAMLWWCFVSPAERGAILATLPFRKIRL